MQRTRFGQRKLAQSLTAAALLLIFAGFQPAQSSAQDSAVPQGTASPDQPKSGDDASDSKIVDPVSPTEQMKEATELLKRVRDEFSKPHPVFYDMVKARDELSKDPGDKYKKSRYQHLVAQTVEVLSQRLEAFSGVEPEILEAVNRVATEAAEHLKSAQKRSEEYAAKAKESDRKIADSRAKLAELDEKRKQGTLTDDEISDARSARSDHDREFVTRKINEAEARTIAARVGKLQSAMKQYKTVANVMRVQFREAHNHQIVLSHIASLWKERAGNAALSEESSQAIATVLTTSESSNSPFDMLKNLTDDALFPSMPSEANQEAPSPLSEVTNDFGNNLDALFDLPDSDSSEPAESRKLMTNKP